MLSRALLFWWPCLGVCKTSDRKWITGVLREFWLGFGFWLDLLFIINTGVLVWLACKLPVTNAISSARYLEEQLHHAPKSS